jgi:hypothetical protein
LNKGNLTHNFATEKAIALKFAVYSPRGQKTVGAGVSPVDACGRVGNTGALSESGIDLTICTTSRASLKK